MFWNGLSSDDPGFKNSLDSRHVTVNSHIADDYSRRIHGRGAFFRFMYHGLQPKATIEMRIWNHPVTERKSLSKLCWLTILPRGDN